MKNNISIRDLKDKGSVSIAYPTDLRQAVQEATDFWRVFCALPLEFKTQLPYSNNSDGVGYELKNGIGNKADRKENLDITLGGKKWLEENIKDINPVALEFFKRATALVSVMKPTVLEFARQSEQAFGLKGFVEEVEKGEDVFFVRFIHYFGDRQSGEEIASAHTDQSGFTLHLYESAPGLQCLTFDKKWIDMPVSEGETVIIPSMQMQLRSDCNLKALCHRVIANEETSRTGRYSAVCFVQLKNTPKYDKNTHGRLQEKEPAFNYKMLTEEFAKLFKK
jgi:isopenicillin N synthase-like dioxygenase